MIIFTLLVLQPPAVPLGEEGFTVTDLRGLQDYEAEEDSPECAVPEEARGLFWFGEKDARTGDVLNLQPKWVTGPGLIRIGFSECIESLNLSAGAPAEVTKTGQSVRILPEAEHGTTFEIMAQVSGQRVEASVRILDPARNPLADRWTEDSRECRDILNGSLIGLDHAKPIRELDLGGDGSYSVTYEHPMEGYRDYWGRYAFDLTSRNIVLVVADGNQTPGPVFKGDGKFSVRNGNLIMDNIYLGSSTNRNVAVSCKYVFRPL